MSKDGDDHLQQASFVQPSLWFILVLAFPFPVVFFPIQPVHECEYPTVRALRTPLPAGLLSLTTQIGIVLQPSHLPVGCSSIFTGAGFATGFAARRFMYWGHGPASAAAAKSPLAKTATELRRRVRGDFIGV